MGSCPPGAYRLHSTGRRRRVRVGSCKVKKGSQERPGILFPPNENQQTGKGGGREEGDSHCGSSGELRRWGEGARFLLVLANELVPLPPGAQGRLWREVGYSADSSKAPGVGQALCKALGTWGVNENSPCCQGSHSQAGR